MTAARRGQKAAFSACRQGALADPSRRHGIDRVQHLVGLILLRHRLPFVEGHLRRNDVSGNPDRRPKRPETIEARIEPAT